ncbi:MAG: TonB-dependent receptor [Porticoccaceae bacterium]
MNTRKKITHTTTLLMACSGALGTAQGASAQGALEEIIVTATKREQSMQEVPITISAITGDGLQRLGIEGMDELAVVTPGLHFGRQTGAAVVLMRGIGTNNGSAGNEPSIATYIDGVYNPNGNANVASFADIERIEVLKGPQGTLFGRNATGGLIHVITKDPSQESEAKFRVGYGNYDTFEGGFYGSTGLTENTAANISVRFKDQGDSPLDSSVSGVNYVPDEDVAVRVKWLYQPSEDLEIKLTGYYSESKSSTFVARKTVPGARAQNGVAPTGDFWTMNNEIPTHARIRTSGANAQIRYSFDNVDLVSISSWAKEHQYAPFDNDGTPLLLQNSYAEMPAETITQEFRLVSTGDSRFNWIAGLYLYQNSAWYDPLRVDIPTAGGIQLFNYSNQDVESWAVFGEGSYAITDRTSLTIGLRWNEDNLDYSGNSYTTFGPVFPFTTQETSFEEATYRISLDHKLTDSLMLYGTYSRGYKTGLFNLINLGGPPTPALEPEILDAYEIGFKSDGWMDGRVRFNGAAFYYDYQDLQVVVVGAVALSSASAAAATIYGGELELNAQVTDGLNISAGFAYTNSEYDQYVGTTNRPAPSGNGNVVVQPVDFSGNELFRAPEITFNAAIHYLLPTDIGEFGFSANYYHNGGFYWDEDNRLKEPSHQLVNLEASWTDPSSKYKVSLWGRNIFEEKYSVYTNNSPSSGDAYVPSEPRMYGVNFEYNFF